MRALIVCGSRDGGFTSEMCRSFANGLAPHGILSDVVFPIDKNIKHCTGCGECSKDGECGISDDMKEMFELFGKCDLLVLASPIHFSGPSSVIKTVIDRFQPIWFRDMEHPAFAAALLSGGDQSPQFTNTISIFKAFSITAGTEWLGHLAIPGTDKMKKEDVIGPSFEYGNEIGLRVIKDRRSSFGNLYRQPPHRRF